MMGGALARMEQKRDIYRIFFCQGGLEGKRPLGKPRRRWESDININLQEMECETCTELLCVRSETCGGLF
jgi:hypothetical protein